MTDHGGAASPRTEHRRSAHHDYDPTPVCLVCGKAWDETGEVLPTYACPASPGQRPGFRNLPAIERLALIREAEAAQEAPAPEGLRAALREALRGTRCQPDEPELDRIIHDTFDRAEARPPEGLAEPGVKWLRGYVTEPRPDARATAHVYFLDQPPMSPEHTGWTGSGETEAEALGNLGLALAARLSAGGATKP